MSTFCCQYHRWLPLLLWVEERKAKKGRGGSWKKEKRGGEEKKAERGEKMGETREKEEGEENTEMRKKKKEGRKLVIQFTFI